MKNFNDGQEIVFEDLNRLSTNIQRELYDILTFELIGRNENAFFQDSLNVGYSNATSVVVNKGLGFIRVPAAGDEEPTLRPLYVRDAQTVSLPVPDVVFDRIDLLIARPIRETTKTESRNFKDAVTNDVDTISMPTQIDWACEYDILQGVPSGSPAVPTYPTDAVVLAEILQTAAIGVQNPSSLTDVRDLLPLGSDSVINTVGYLNVNENPVNVVSNVLRQLDEFTRYLNVDRGDFIFQSVEPANPSPTELRVWAQNNDLYIKRSDGTKRLVSERPTHKLILLNNTIAQLVDGLGDANPFGPKRADVYQGLRFKYHIRRVTASEPEQIEMGEFYAHFKEVGGALVSDTTFVSHFGDCGVEFSIAEDLVSIPGEVTFWLAAQTTNWAGADHECHLTINDFNLIEVF